MSSEVSLPPYLGDAVIDEIVDNAMAYRVGNYTRELFEVIEPHYFLGADSAQWPEPQSHSLLFQEYHVGYFGYDEFLAEPRGTVVE